ncbi:MAG: hypothetical protein ACKV2Q_11220 [Planctomycetaceae bacterium]
MEAQKRTRRVNRDRSERGEQSPRGAKQFVIPTTAAQYDEIWTDSQRMRLREVALSKPVTQTWPAAVPAMLGKLRNKTNEDAIADNHPDCHRTSNLVDRLMNRLYRLMYAGRGQAWPPMPFGTPPATLGFAVELPPYRSARRHFPRTSMPRSRTTILTTRDRLSRANEHD